MPKNRPNKGDADWGLTLNAHLNQLMPTGGGINFATTRPTTLTASDDGYTMVDTTTRELIRWTGTAWVVLLGGTDKGLETLETDRNYYVSTTGNDSNNGLSTTSPFLTIQKAVDTIYSSLNVNGKKVIINVAPGAYTPNSTTIVGLPAGGGKSGYGLTIKGTGATTSETILRANQTNPFIINATRGAGVNVENLKVEIVNQTYQSPLWLIGFAAMSSGSVGFKNIDFGNFRTTDTGVAGMHLYSQDNGNIGCSEGASYIVSGGATHHYYSQSGGSLINAYNGGGVTVNVSNSVTFSSIYSGSLGTRILINNTNWLDKQLVTATSKGYLDGLTIADADAGNIPGPNWNLTNGSVAY